MYTTFINQCWQAMRWHHLWLFLHNEKCVFIHVGYRATQTQTRWSIFSATQDLNRVDTKGCCTGDWVLSQTTLFGLQYSTNTVYDNRLTVSIWSQWPSRMHVYVWEGFWDGCNAVPLLLWAVRPNKLSQMFSCDSVLNDKKGGVSEKIWNLWNNTR